MKESRADNPGLGPALVALLAAPAALLWMAAGCGRQASHGARPSSPPRVEETKFAGDGACAECHPAESGLHRASRHALTMRPANRASLGPLAPPIGPIRGTKFAISADGDGFRFGRADRPSDGPLLCYALGSGKDAITYVGEFGPDRLTEFRMTYLANRREWCVTPGQEKMADDGLGDVNELGMARRCILCHATRTLRESPAPDPGFLGVGCESCHGPGADHVQAARAGRSVDGGMESMAGRGAARINQMCARCHRSIDDVSLVGSNATGTARFAGVGLELSRCFKESGNRLSCVTCHNPHADTRADSAGYENACLTCHSPAGVPARGGGKACPVNPRRGCIPCHMPKRPIFDNSHVGIFMADHLIMAYRSPQRSAR